MIRQPILGSWRWREKEGSKSFLIGGQQACEAPSVPLLLLLCMSSAQLQPRRLPYPFRVHFQSAPQPTYDRALACSPKTPSPPRHQHHRASLARLSRVARVENNRRQRLSLGSFDWVCVGVPR